MTDEELIARLRSGDTILAEHYMNEAADRIEQLKHRLFQCASDLQIYMDAFAVSEAKLATCEKYRDAYDECDRIGTQAVRDLEAKLAKAVEGLEKIAGAADREWTTARCGGLCDIARATLAEIKGESHDVN